MDDEPALVEGIQRSLGRTFAFTTASSGPEALELLEKSAAPFEVIVSDFRMPHMDGVTFLKRAQAVTPDSVRILLTGQWETGTAIAAVNEGNVFRFLTKPCPSTTLSQVLKTAVEQHRLVTSERVLLEQTLRGSIQTLVRVLSLASPEAFGRANRVKRTVLDAARALKLDNTWALEVAAMLSQLGSIVLPPDTLGKAYRNEPLSNEEKSMLERLPAVALELVEGIPRLDEVREILRYQAKHYDGSGSPVDKIKGDAIPVGARLLHIALDCDAAESSGSTEEEAIALLRGRGARYDQRLVDVVAAQDAATASRNGPIRELALTQLRSGMLLVNDVRSKNGMLLVARGHAVTYEMLERLRNIGSRMGVAEPIRARVP